MKKNKLKGSSLNKQEELLEFLKSDLPEIFSEGKIDCKKLKQTLGEEVDDSNERYGLSWAGKNNCFQTIQGQTTATLKPAKDESVDFDKTQNVFIEGDNLEVLKVLQRSYYGKVKMIYIDPPYNTGNDFIYNDKFQENRDEYLESIGEKDGNGNSLRIDGLSRNTKDSGHYHSNWLNMMYPRLFLARNLLQQDGVIFVSIDDNEVKNLRMIMDEIFGEENLVGQFTVQTNPRGSQASKHLANVHEYILMYSKLVDELQIKGFSKEGRTIDEYSSMDENDKKYRLLGLRQRGGAWKREDRPNMFYPIFVNPKTSKVSLNKGESYYIKCLPKRPTGEEGRWTWSKSKVKKDGKILFGKKVNRNGDGDFWDIFRKDYLEDEEGVEKRSKPKTIWTDKKINYQNGRTEIKELFNGKDIFDFPKPAYLIKRMIDIVDFDEGGIILDFFAGSGTTAQAVMEQNAKDGGNRRWICVQLPELCDEESEAYKAGYKTIAEIGKERIRRAGSAVAKAMADKKKIDIGFKVLKLDKSNFKIWSYSAKASSDKQGKSILEYMEEFVDNVQKGSKEENILFELVLKSGLDLNVQVEEKKFGNDKYYSLDGGKLIIYLGKKITKEMAEEIKKAKPEKFICLDGCFQNNDQLKTNISLQLEQEKIDFKVI